MKLLVAVLGMTLGLVLNAHAEKPDIEEFNSTLAGIFAPVQNENTKGALVFDNLEVGRSHIFDATMHAIYHKGTPGDSFEFKINKLHYHYRPDADPIVSFSGSFATDKISLIDVPVIADQLSRQFNVRMLCEYLVPGPYGHDDACSEHNLFTFMNKTPEGIPVSFGILLDAHVNLKEFDTTFSQIIIAADVNNKEIKFNVFMVYNPRFADDKKHGEKFFTTEILFPLLDKEPDMISEVSMSAMYLDKATTYAWSQATTVADFLWQLI
jgi:hypothetical protein